MKDTLIPSVCPKTDSFRVCGTPRLHPESLSEQGQEKVQTLCRTIFSRKALVIASLLIGILFLEENVAQASSSSRQWVIQGIEMLRQQEYRAALDRFETASNEDPLDGEAVYFQGVALNRLGRPGPALERFQVARAMGVTRADLAFESGWSLLYLRRWQEAIDELEQYERTSPGRGQTSEFLGRAYYALGRYDKAETLLKEAIERDPDLASTARLFLALVARAKGSEAAIQAHLMSLMEDAPDSPLAQRLQKQVDLETEAAAAAGKPFRISASAGGGYNDNVIALGKGVNLPQDISRQKAGFFQSSLNGSYTWRIAGAHLLTGGYRFLTNVYDGLSEFNLIDHYFYLDYRHSLRRDFTATLRLSDEITRVGGSKFRDQFGARPAVSWQVTDEFLVEFAYSFFSADYFFPTTSDLDRDGTTHSGSLTTYLQIPGLPLRGRLGGFHLKSDTEGSDFDMTGTGVVAGVTAFLLPRLTADFSYSRTWDRYDNPNSLSGATGFAFPRRDDIDRIGAQVTWAALERFNAYLRYDRLSADSNIRFYNFDQNIFSGGVVFFFP